MYLVRRLSFIKESTKNEQEHVVFAQDRPLLKCTNCGNYSVVNQGGCYVCLNCGWAKCDV